MKILVAGATGFVGGALVPRLREKSHEVVAVSRDPASAGRLGVRAIPWEGGSLEREVEGAGAVVNLSGENLFARRWSAIQKERLRKSRVEATRRIVQALAKARARPGVLVSGSAIGYYGPRQNEVLTETAASGGDFLALLCEEWEEEARKAEAVAVRVARLRTGIVLGRGGGALAKMVPPFRMFAGGPLGSGRQWMSWIHIQDLAGLILLAIENDAIFGAINGTAPEPQTMRDFCKSLGRALGRPSWAPVPAFALRLALGEVADILLTGQRVLPKRALDCGYSFRFPDAGAALRDLVG